MYRGTISIHPFYNCKLFIQNKDSRVDTALHHTILSQLYKNVHNARNGSRALDHKKYLGLIVWCLSSLYLSLSVRECYRYSRYWYDLAFLYFVQLTVLALSTKRRPCCYTLRSSSYSNTLIIPLDTIIQYQYHFLVLKSPHW